MAKIITKHENSGGGCVVQFTGLVALFFFPIGTIFGIILLVWGSQLSKRLLCGNCKNRIDNNQVTLCPACKEILEK